MNPIGVKHGGNNKFIFPVRQVRNLCRIKAYQQALWRRLVFHFTTDLLHTKDQNIQAITLTLFKAMQVLLTLPVCLPFLRRKGTAYLQNIL